MELPMSRGISAKTFECLKLYNVGGAVLKESELVDTRDDQT